MLQIGDTAYYHDYFWLPTAAQMRDYDAAVTLTDSDGRYAIDWSIIPIGEYWLSTNEWGGGPVRYTISDTVSVSAWLGDAVDEQSVVLNRRRTADIDFTIR
jgi:hypothetical protein